MAAWTAAREPGEEPWEGFASAHTWIHAEHGWWHLVPRPLDAPAPAGGARLGFEVPCHVLTAYNPDGRAAAEADNRAAARALRADHRPHGLVVLPCSAATRTAHGWSQGLPSSASPGTRPGRWDGPMASSRSTSWMEPSAASSPAAATMSSRRLSSAVADSRPRRCRHRRHSRSWVAASSTMASPSSFASTPSAPVPPGPVPARPRRRRRARRAAPGSAGSSRRR